MLTTDEPVVYDVVIVGAGLSGVGASVHLVTACPGRTFTILEGRSATGGTWDLFRYPGVRSDSDMHTLGYEFKPWKSERSIADGPSILEYLRETIIEYDLDRHIRLGHQVERADWSSERGEWTVTVARPADDASSERITFRCRFLYVCAGYYSYSSAHRPEFVGESSFPGTIVHPQFWPDDLDYSGAAVAVIGSGATAVTLVPALAKTAAQVTMVQRTPTYVVAQPDIDRFDGWLRGVLPETVAYRLTRRKNILRDQLVYSVSRIAPQWLRRALLRRVRNAIGPEQTADNFTPDYNPWDQRLCLVPNGDLFDAINSRKATVVTGRIERFTSEGILLTSGEIVAADIIVTATGLELVSLGGIDIWVDGDRVDFAETFTYRGVAYSGVPNLVTTFGYVNASWTLRADLVATFTTRLLNHMESVGANVCVPTLRPDDEAMRPRPFVDDFTPGYLARAQGALPMQGTHDPWVNPQRYRRDRKSLLERPLDDGVMRFHRVAEWRGRKGDAVR